jgi:hypothetical protein
VPWPHDDVVAIDVLGVAHTARLEDRRVGVPVSITPVFLSAGT